MSLRLPPGLLDLALRLMVRRKLDRIASPQAMRAEFERTAARFFRFPRGAVQAWESHEAPAGPVWALRVTHGETGPGLIVHLHGGAYLAGSPATHRHLGAALSAAARMPVLLPDYALAPERPYPAAIADALAVWQGLMRQGHNPATIALSGDSAGGGLAAALLLRLAGAGLPMPGALCLFSPWADMTMTARSLTRNDRTEAMLPMRRMPEVIGHYLQGADPADPFASPVLGRFERPPPALILAGQGEALADDAAALCAALRAGGGAVRLELWPQMPHAWPMFVGLLAGADRAVAQAGAFISQRLRAEAP